MKTFLHRIVERKEQRESLMLITAAQQDDLVMIGEILSDGTPRSMTKMVVHMAYLNARLIRIIAGHTGEEPEQVGARFGAAVAQAIENDTPDLSQLPPLPDDLR